MGFMMTSDIGLNEVFGKPFVKSAEGGDMGELTNGECISFVDEGGPPWELLESGLVYFFSKLSIITGG